MPSPRGELDRALRVKANHEASLMRIAGVEGVAVGEAKGHPAIVVYVSDPALSQPGRLPARIQGVPVEVFVGGPFQAH